MSTDDKAVRLVEGGQVAVTYVSPSGVLVAGMVRGDSDTIYNVTLDPAGAWCDCPYGQHHRGQHCSHTKALYLQATTDYQLQLPVLAPAATLGSQAEGA